MTPDKPTQHERAEAGHRTKVTLDELVAKGRTFVDRVESVVRRVADKLGKRSG